MLEEPAKSAVSNILNHMPNGHIYTARFSEFISACLILKTRGRFPGVPDPKTDSEGERVQKKRVSTLEILSQKLIKLVFNGTK